MEPTPRACTGNPIALSHFEETYRAELKLELSSAACWSRGSWAVVSSAPSRFSCPVCPVPFAALVESTPRPSGSPRSWPGGGVGARQRPSRAAPAREGAHSSTARGLPQPLPLLELGLFTGDAEPGGRCKRWSPLLLLGFVPSQRAGPDSGMTFS